MFTFCYAACNISRAKGSPFETWRYAPESGYAATTYGTSNEFSG